jgi:hypothetical protein
VASVDLEGQELRSSQLFEDAVFWAEVEEEDEGGARGGGGERHHA